MKREKVQRAYNKKINYSFADNKEKLAILDRKKEKLNRDVKRYNCQPLINQLNQDVESDFIIFDTPEKAEFFINHPNFKIIKQTNSVNHPLAEESRYDNSEPEFQLFAYDVIIQNEKPETLELFEEEPEKIKFGPNKGKWLRYFQVKLPSKQFKALYNLAQDIDDGREINSSYLSDLHFYFYKDSKQSGIAGSLRNSGLCFMSQLNYQVPGGSWQEVDKFLTNLMENYKNDWSSMHPIEKAVAIHNEIVALQPFADGNKRIARLVLNSILLEYGYPTIETRRQDSVKYINAVHDSMLYLDGQAMFDLIFENLNNRIDECQDYVDEYAIANSDEGEK